MVNKDVYLVITSEVPGKGKNMRGKGS